jgi:hypothetical protein
MAPNNNAAKELITDKPKRMRNRAAPLGKRATHDRAEILYIRGLIASDLKARAESLAKNNIPELVKVADYQRRWDELAGPDAGPQPE